MAAADALGGKPESEFTSALPGGIGANSGVVWVSLLDGGVGVEVGFYEHESTNRLHGQQRTTIRGPKAYRALLALLGFAWSSRKLPGENAALRQEKIQTLVNDLLGGRTR